MEPKLVKAFEIRCKVGKPIFIGQDGKAGRRQLIAITGGDVIGFALPFNGTVLDGGVDSQVVRPDGRAELSARYGVKLDDGRSFYIQNDGIRTVCAGTCANRSFRRHSSGRKLLLRNETGI